MLGLVVGFVVGFQLGSKNLASVPVGYSVSSSDSVVGELVGERPGDPISRIFLNCPDVVAEVGSSLKFSSAIYFACSEFPWKVSLLLFSGALCPGSSNERILAACITTASVSNTGIIIKLNMVSLLSLSALGRF